VPDDLTADLSWGQTWPRLDLFLELARERRVIPVVRRLLADAETPLSLYRKLARDEPGTFLLESAEHGGVWSRYSIVGARSRATLTEKDGEAFWIGEPPVGVPTSGDPTAALDVTLQTLATARIDGLPDDWWATYRDKLEAVDVVAAHDAATDLITPDEFLILVVGDAARVRDELEALDLGPMEVVSSGAAAEPATDEG
jgi:hypothetical protein